MSKIKGQNPITWLLLMTAVGGAGVPQTACHDARMLLSFAAAYLSRTEGANAAPSDTVLKFSLSVRGGLAYH